MSELKNILIEKEHRFGFVIIHFQQRKPHVSAFLAQPSLIDKTYVNH